MQALLVLIENWKKVLDNKGFGGAVLMDLPKAFDTINNDIFIAKLHASGTQLGERGGDLPCPFLKIEKSALTLEIKALIVSIFGLNLSFKM